MKRHPTGSPRRSPPRARLDDARILESRPAVASSRVRSGLRARHTGRHFGQVHQLRDPSRGQGSDPVVLPPARRGRSTAAPSPACLGDIRFIGFLNHTSLYEPLFAALVPIRCIWEISKRAVVPVAAKTLDRPILGRFFQLLIPHPVSITREADHTWAVVWSTGDASMVLILPEGRMRGRTGLDLEGRPMTARGGVADILRAIDDGQLLMAYSGGLHHVQIPGQ